MRPVLRAPHVLELAAAPLPPDDVQGVLEADRGVPAPGAPLTVVGHEIPIPADTRTMDDSSTHTHARAQNKKKEEIVSFLGSKRQQQHHKNTDSQINKSSSLPPPRTKPPSLSTPNLHTSTYMQHLCGIDSLRIIFMR